MSSSFVKDYVATASGKGHVQISDISPIKHDVQVKLSKSFKNLFNLSKIEAVDSYAKNLELTSNGFSFTRGYGSGRSIYVSYIEFFTSGVYTISGEATSSDGSSSVGFAVMKDGTIIYNHSTSGVNATFEISEDGEYTLGFYSARSSAEGTVTTFSNIQLEAGDTATEYEPYFSTFEGMKVTTCGNNLFDINGEVSRTRGGAYVSDGKVKDDGGSGMELVEFAKVYPAGVYTVSFKINDSSSPSYSSYNSRRILLSAQATVVRGGYLIGYNAFYEGYLYSISNDAITFTMENPFVLGFALAAETGASAELYDIQLESGSTATPYTPYMGAEYTANADGTVPGVKSISPAMHIFTEIPSVSIEATYYNQLYDGGVAERLVTIAENVPKVYAAGQKSMVDESKIVEKTVTGHGAVYVDDVSEIPHTVQVKLSGPAGKNLIPYPYASGATYQSNGITYTMLDDGGIRLNGANNGSWQSSYFLLKRKLIRAGTYRFSLKGTNGTIGNIFAYNVNGTNKYDGNTKVIFTEDTYADLYIQVLATDTTVFDNLVVYPMLELGDTVTEYEPYTEDFTGKKVTVCGKNLADFNAMAEYIVANDSGASIVTFQDRRCLRLENAWNSVSIKMPNELIRNMRFTAYVDGSYTPSFFTVVFTTGNLYAAVATSREWTTVNRYMDDGGIIKELQLYAANGGNPVYIDIDSVMFEASVTSDYEPYVGGEYTANADGVDAKSVSPNMHVIANADISATYHRSYGMDLHYNRFWDEYQELGTRTNYDGAFCGKGWSNNTIRPKYDICPTQAMWFMRYSSFSGDLVKHLEEMGVSLDFKDCVYFNEAFANAFYITRVGVIDLRKCTAAYNTTDMFTNANALVTIDKVIADEGTVINYGAFRRLSALENITFEGVIVSNDLRFSDSPLLTHSSLMSIINALQDKTGDTSGTSWVVTIGATNKAKLTEAELKIATDKGWTIN